MVICASGSFHKGNRISIPGLGIASKRWYFPANHTITCEKLAFSHGSLCTVQCVFPTYILYIPSSNPGHSLKPIGMLKPFTTEHNKVQRDVTTEILINMPSIVDRIFFLQNYFFTCHTYE